MRVHVVSDVHGRNDALRSAADGADLLICLGDLLVFLDYLDPSVGIYPDLLGVEATRHFIDLRTAGRYQEASDFSAALWARVSDEYGLSRSELMERKIHEQYEQVFAAMPEPALLTYGNVDVPSMWAQYLRPGHTVLDAKAVDLDGLRFGFVGGGLRSPMRTPYEIEPEQFAANLDAVGPVDVLCTHIPPADSGLLYDVVARREEVGSADLRRYVEDVQPRLSLFGHVHQPLSTRRRIGRTECVNVGHFRATGTPFVLEW